MGRNAAFGRPQARDRFRLWWYDQSQASRANIFVALAVGAAVVALLFAASWRDTSGSNPPPAAGPPQLGLGLVPSTLSRVIAGDLSTAGAPVPTGDPLDPGSTTTSSSAIAPADPVPAQPSRAVPATTSPPSTAAPAPVTTVTNPNVIFTEVQAPATTMPATTTPATTTPVTLPPAEPTTTTSPPTTSPPSTTSPPTTRAPGLLPPIDLPPLLGG